MSIFEPRFEYEGLKMEFFGSFQFVFRKPSILEKESIIEALSFDENDPPKQC